jgi:hypothetical protein
VTLTVSVGEALRRVAADTGRRASRIPELLRASHAEFATAPPIADVLMIDSTNLSVDEVAYVIRAALERERLSDGVGADPATGVRGCRLRVASGA